MAEKSTWIKLDRNILEWGWYKDANTARLFIHLLLKANIKDAVFMGVRIKRGELATSQPNLAEELDLSVFNVRTAIKHLKATGEITVRTTPKFSVISIVNYERYQENPQSNAQATSRSSHSQPTGNPQQSKNIRRKERKNIEETPAATEQASDSEYRPQWWEVDKPKQFWGRFQSEDDYWDFMQNGGE